MAVDHKKIRELLGEEEAAADNSLRANSLRRALSGKPPKTLTPHEWEQWYAMHGVPEAHLKIPARAVRLSWWSRIRDRWHLNQRRK